MCLAVPGKILAIEENDDPLLRGGTVSFGGVGRRVNLAYVPQAQAGDYVIVHAGFALNTVDAQEAQRIFNDLEEIDRLNDKS